MVENFVLILISLIISAGVFFAFRLIIKKSMKDLNGAQKLLGIVSILIVFSEIVYLGTALGLFEFALEIITSIGVGMVLLGIALQHQLKNIVAGIGIYFNREINVGDSIMIKEVKGVIIELHLTKIIALTEDGGKIMIPNQKLAEDMVILYNKQRSSI